MQRKDCVMSRWTMDSPVTLDFDGIVALKVRIVAGSVAVLATADRPRLDITEVSGQPLLVTHEAGILTISYEDLRWDGLLGWLRPQRHSANITVMVQKDCPLQISAVNATAVVSGVSARATLKTVSGDLALDDGRIGRLDAKTVSGRVTADVDLAPAGEMRIGTLSGEVAIRLPAQASAEVNLRSASGQVHTDFPGVCPGPGSKTVTGTLGGGSGKLSVASMSGDVTILRGSRTPGADGGAGAADGGAGAADAADAAPPGESAAMESSGPAKEGESR